MRDRTSDTAHRHATPGGPPGKGQVVHHKDENKNNNATGNLEVQTRGAHSRGHASGPGRRLSKLRKSLTMETRNEKLY